MSARRSCPPDAGDRLSPPPRSWRGRSGPSPIRPDSGTRAWREARPERRGRGGRAGRSASPDELEDRWVLPAGHRGGSLLGGTLATDCCKVSSHRELACRGPRQRTLQQTVAKLPPTSASAELPELAGETEPVRIACDSSADLGIHLSSSRVHHQARESSFIFDSGERRAAAPSRCRPAIAIGAPPTGGRPSCFR